jgi:hypothetical protein
MTKAPLGGEGTRPNPTDRSESGTKRSLLTDGRGVPLGVAVDEGVKIAPGVRVKDGVAVVLGEGACEAAAVAMRVGNDTRLDSGVTG